MKQSNLYKILLAFMLMLTACNTKQVLPEDNKVVTDIVDIALSDDEIKVDGELAKYNEENRVYIGNDIVYYESGKDFIYGEGSEKDAHSAEKAAEHTVIHITQPGTYRISGSLSKGQIAIDLGDDAKKDPEAVVTLILNDVDITCEVAPAIIFYNVYECGSTDNATMDVDTSSAGANVIIADNTTNTINGSYVARIYKPGSVVLNESGTEVEDAKKLHKYDAAFYSKMSMYVSGESENNGILIINADNEGLDSELHLTINGGIIHINSGNDGINTNEDGVSVTTINGGNVYIQVTGETGEGDGIDSNGWLVINGGSVIAQGCAFSADAGIDSDMGIHINGGTVIASGNMLDKISESDQTYVVLNFNKFLGAGTYSVKNSDHSVILKQEIKNSFTSLIISSADLIEGDYTLWYNDHQLVGAMTENRGMFDGMRPGMGEMPEGMAPPKMPDGFDPDKMTPPDGFNDNNMHFDRNEDGTIKLPDGPFVDPSKFEDGRPAGKGSGGNMPNEAIELSEIFTIKEGPNYYSFISIRQ